MLSEKTYMTQKSESSNHKPNQSVQFKDNRNPSVSNIQKMANDSIQMKPNNTGLPNQLKSGIESLSGYSMADVKVHYNSSKPAQLNAHAFAQGTDIHVASGQEKHLPHEAWHVVQQKQGRVQPTKQLKGKVNINDDAGLEREADVMGAKALQMVGKNNDSCQTFQNTSQLQKVAQLRTTVKHTTANYNYGGGTERVGIDMEAWLDPNDPKQGSVPQNGELTNVMGAFTNANYRSMKRGHLLNDNLGGLGLDYNLYPITAQANSHHKTKVESFVKQRVANNHGCYYRVRVQNATNNILAPNADFECTLQEWTPGAWGRGRGNILFNRRIESRPVVNNTGTGLSYDANGLLGAGTGFNFQNANLPNYNQQNGWGNQGNNQVGWIDPNLLTRFGISFLR